MKTILMTGAAGGVARFLRDELPDKYALRLCDRDTPADLGENETFIAADLLDMAALRDAVQGVDAIIHLGAFSVESTWETILDANIVGTYNLYEAARHAGVRRVIFASSNHAVGFYARATTIDHTVYPKPDSRYGVSKVFGEALASLYANKYGVESLCVRIGNVAEQPIDRRRLAIWISPRDLAQLLAIGIEHPDIRFEIVYGASENAPHAWWDNSNAVRLGYRPEDRSDDYAQAVLSQQPPEVGDERTFKFQGGTFVTTETGGDPTKPDPQ
ncbi:MAG: NAD(P)-dependent oxidoreductase [Gammaproteobacteria bacterium]|nr:NAD(P)-dependent oxidoreductase [Gammaproteobacteria bacterium]